MRLFAPIALLLACGCAVDRMAVQVDLGATGMASAPQLTVQSDCGDAAPCGDVFDSAATAPGSWNGRPSWGVGGSLTSGLRLVPRLHLDLGFFEVQYERLALAPVPAFGSPAAPGTAFSAPGEGADLFFFGEPLSLRWSPWRSWDVYATVVPGLAALVKPVVASTGGASSLGLANPWDLIGRVGIERSFDFGRYGLGLYAQADTSGLFDGGFLALSLHFGDDPYREIP